MRSIVLSFLIAGLAPFAFARTAVRADDAGQFDVRPAPAWADVLHPDLHAPQRIVRSGIDGLLEDHQVRVVGANVDEYFRDVRKVLTSAGVQNASEISIDFDPSYERLVIHDVGLVRDGKRIDELTREEVRIIEKETTRTTVFTTASSPRCSSSKMFAPATSSITPGPWKARTPSSADATPANSISALPFRRGSSATV